MTEQDTQNAIIELLQLKGAVVTRVNSGRAVFERDGIVNIRTSINPVAKMNCGSNLLFMPKAWPTVEFAERWMAGLT